MIFVTLGSQEFQFNRLLKEIDKLVKEKVIKEKVFAQIGYSDYEPSEYSYEKFLSREKFNDIIKKADVIITHGGTGSIISGVKNRKKVIAVPRLCKYKEHVDNHQIDIVKKFDKMGLIIGTRGVEEIKEVLEKINYVELREYESNNANVVSIIDKFICRFL